VSHEIGPTQRTDRLKWDSIRTVHVIKEKLSLFWFLIYRINATTFQLSFSTQKEGQRGRKRVVRGYRNGNRKLCKVRERKRHVLLLSWEIKAQGMN
jgi:hypothetical protein